MFRSIFLLFIFYSLYRFMYYAPVKLIQTPSPSV